MQIFIIKLSKCLNPSIKFIVQKFEIKQLKQAKSVLLIGAVLSS